MTALEIFEKHMRPLGTMRILDETLNATVCAMEEYGIQKYLEGQSEAETWKRLVVAKEIKIRELEQKLETIKNAIL